MSFDKTLRPEGCQDWVYSRDTWHSYQCQKAPKVVRDGKNYCTIHDPEYLAKKEEKRRAAHKSKTCKCGYYFDRGWYRFCPLCGTRKSS